MSKERDNENDRMFGKLSEAICALTCELKALREQREASLVTKCDLAAAEARIAEAIEHKLSAEDRAALRGIERTINAIVRDAEGDTSLDR